MRLLVLITVFLLTSCAGPMPLDYPLDLSRCGDEDVECVLAEVDKIPESAVPDEIRFSYMEGYLLAPLMKMYDAGNIEIRDLNGWWLGLTLAGFGPIARTQTYVHKHGDIVKAEVEYLSWAPWSNWLLAHELEHIKGIKGPYEANDHYGREQEAIMKAEGVDHWYETSVYRLEDPTYHRRVK